MNPLLTIAAAIAGCALGALHQVAHRVGTWAAGTAAYMATVAVVAALALYAVVASDAVPLVVCGVLVAALYPWRRG